MGGAVITARPMTAGLLMFIAALIGFTQKAEAG
jgi:hypothetical protein